MAGDVKRFYKRPVFFVPAVIILIPAIWLAWWLGSPLFLDKTVDEPFPVAAAAAATPPATTAVAPPEAPTPTTGEPASVPSPTTAATGAAPSSAPTPSSTGPEPAPPGTEAVSGPLALLSGVFKDADSRHHGSGDATIYEQADGTRFLRLENLDVTNGPDLHVFLAPVADASEREHVMAEGYLDLGSLKGNIGNQNYPITGDLDLEGEWTVVIYCVPFHVIFSTAPLA